MWDQLDQLHAYHRDVPVGIRLLKLTEEVGEVADAFLGVHGLNKPKGVPLENLVPYCELGFCSGISSVAGTISECCCRSSAGC
jgi:hypothetical protein